MSDAIRFDEVSLWRRTQEEFGYDLKGLIFSVAQRRFRAARRRLVLDDVSFAVEQGEKIGVIGANGSGKSTILKLIAGILKPSSGRVRANGRIAPLIELGAGFDLDLSVEDNIVYNGILLGHARDEMRRRIDGILDFAQLHEHRHVPLKALSSGMGARLGFAIATDIRPDLLLIDEILSVGDESFRHRSAERIQEIWQDHATIVLVSHDVNFIAEQCERALWIEAGRVRMVGPAAEIAKRYLDDVADHEAAATGSVRFAPEAVGHIDAVTRTGVERVFVRGWIVLPESKRRGTRASVLIDGRLFGDVAYGDERPDVAAVHGEEASLSGFHVDLPAGGLERGEHQLTVAVFDGDTERYHPLPTTSLTIEGPLPTLVTA